MSESDEPDLSQLPEPSVRRPRRWTVSVIWVVPFIAAVAAGILGVRSYLSAGPSITIDFKTAEGIESGKTEIRYKEVPIGKVKRTELTDDGQNVRVHVSLIHDAEIVAVEDSQFWVVRPRVGIGGVSGLGTLLSGAYIGVDLGHSAEERREFQGLEKPPGVTNDQRGRRFVLTTVDLGSLDAGSPIYYRRIQVGHIIDRSLDADGKRITLQMFVDAPYDKFVTTNTRFWNASGVDVQVDATGFKLNTQSLATVIAGGIAFQPFPEDQPGEPAAENTQFKLFDDRNAAEAPSESESIRLRLRFYQTTRGLTAGSPVDFQGIEVGKVKSLELDYDRDKKDFWTDVAIDVYPRSMGRAFASWQRNTQREPKTADTFFRALIERNLRGQLRTGNLITGQLYIALDFDPKAPKVLPPAGQTPLEVPTSRGEFDQIQEQISSIVTKLDAIPFDQIGNNLNNTLQSADSLVKKLDGQVIPEVQKAVEEAHKTLGAATDALSDNGRLQTDTRGTLDEVGRAARSLRTLADYLQRHPESLLRGRPSGEQDLAPTPLPPPPGAQAAPLPPAVQDKP
ncbi:intermembrane transport protein PqiB [Hydrocarboniphaga sp.]|uniref:PqiB family protein n=1 Tax=Hydrocarboniphaga sp. TaxID=2033016 RepID=UPI003D1534D7